MDHNFPFHFYILYFKMFDNIQFSSSGYKQMSGYVLYKLDSPVNIYIFILQLMIKLRICLYMLFL